MLALGPASFKETRAGVLWDNLVVIGLGLALLILATVGVLTYRATQRLIENATWINDSHNALDQVDSLLLEVLEVESSARAYVLGGKDFYLEPYFASVDRIDRTLRGLERMTAGHADLYRRVLSLKEPIERKVAYHRHQVEVRSQAASEKSLEALATGRGHQLMDEIRRLADGLKADERTLLSQREAEGRLAAQQSTYLLIFG